jgi:hypothetical protein
MERTGDVLMPLGGILLGVGGGLTVLAVIAIVSVLGPYPMPAISILGVNFSWLKLLIASAACFILGHPLMTIGFRMRFFVSGSAELKAELEQKLGFFGFIFCEDKLGRLEIRWNDNCLPRFYSGRAGSAGPYFWKYMLWLGPLHLEIPVGEPYYGGL